MHGVTLLPLPCGSKETAGGVILHARDALIVLPNAVHWCVAVSERMGKNYTAEMINHICKTAIKLDKHIF